ncbi:MAG TPA: hypothetical protein VFX70_11685 [Mycobacteriales bacterium]|nr:hypothetical protein [Mycobacteriales bacterium]
MSGPTTGPTEDSGGNNPDRTGDTGGASGTGGRADRAGALSEREYRSLLRAARAAPSVHNTQPWLFRLRGDRVELWADERRMLAQADPRGRQLVISCGAALLNLRLAVEHLGFDAPTTAYPDRSNGTHLATVVRGPAREPDPETERLYAAVADRHTHRGPHRPEPVGRATAMRLSRAARQEGAVLHEVRTDEQRSLLHEGLRHAIAAELTDRALRAEFLSWVRADGEGDRGDGVPASSWERAPYPTPANHPDGGLTGNDAEALADMVERESFFMLATGTDDPADWLRTGEALQRVLLTAHDAGLAVSFLNQPIEAAALRGLLPSALDLPGVAQMLLRVGYPWTLEPATSRRPLEEIAES